MKADLPVDSEQSCNAEIIVPVEIIESKQEKTTGAT